MRCVLILAALALAACSPKASAPNSPTAPVAEAPAPPAETAPAPAPIVIGAPLQLPPSGTSLCAVRVEAPWAAAGPGWRIVGDAVGDSCADAQVALYVVKPDGSLTFGAVFAARALPMAFGEAGGAPAVSRDSMRAALSGWIAPTPGLTTAELPAWTEGAERPGQPEDEFPFLPDETMGQARYEALRAARRPMLRFVQGTESLSVVALAADGTVVTLGVQTFPG